MTDFSRGLNKYLIKAQVAARFPQTNIDQTPFHAISPLSSFEYCFEENSFA